MSLKARILVCLTSRVVRLPSSRIIIFVVDEGSSQFGARDLDVSPLAPDPWEILLAIKCEEFDHALR